MYEDYACCDLEQDQHYISRNRLMHHYLELGLKGSFTMLVHHAVRQHTREYC